MMQYSHLFCAQCGAANSGQAVSCFVCGKPLQVSSFADGLSGRPQGTTLLHQRYHVVSRVGKGGFGAVYKAVDVQFGNRAVALKEMSLGGINPQDASKAIDAFTREAMLLAGLTHPNLPRIYDHFMDAGHWYVVMDFIEGLNLEQYVNEVKILSLGGVLDIGIQLCKVLGYLHTRQPAIIFRDLKPNNIMLTPDGDIYLVDFGIARHFKAGQVKDTSVFGSPGYAAPEQYGRAQTTPSADIYSLGAVLHQLLTGNDPLFNTPTTFDFPPLHMQGKAAGLEELIMHMLAMDPGKRPASMADIRQELHRVAAQQGIVHTSSVPLVRSVQGQSLPPVGTTLCIYEGHSTYRGSVYGVTAVGWSPDGTRIASASADNTVQVWDTVTGDTILIYHGHSGSETLVAAVGWSPNGTMIASGGGGEDKTVQIWDAASGGSIGIYPGHSKQVNAVAWSPDGLSIASASNDGTVHVWTGGQGESVAMVSARDAAVESVLKYHGHSNFLWRHGVNAVAWSPDGLCIASAGSDGTVQVWDAVTGEHFLTYRGHTHSVYTVAWSPDGMRIASGGGDGTVQVWDAVGGDSVATTGEHIFTYHGHSGMQMWVNTVAWSPDGMRIASGGGGDDRTVQVWDALNGGNVFIYAGHGDFVNAVAWSPNGILIASASHDGTVQVWRAM